MNGVFPSAHPGFELSYIHRNWITSVCVVGLERGDKVVVVVGAKVPQSNFEEEGEDIIVFLPWV